MENSILTRFWGAILEIHGSSTRKGSALIKMVAVPISLQQKHYFEMEHEKQNIILRALGSANIEERNPQLIRLIQIIISFIKLRSSNCGS